MPPEKHFIQPHSREISATARFADLPELIVWIERVANADNIDAATIKRIQLVAEEMFVNTIHHGYGAECDSPIKLRLCIDGNLATLTMIDSAPPFNLLEAASLPADPDRLGGVGLNLVRALSKAIRYQRHDDSNVTMFDFAVVQATC